MYQSLLKQTTDFQLYIFAFDDISCDLLRRMNLSNATIISLKEFETPELLSVKSNRTAAEYCWTCTSFTIWHCIQHYDLDHCTYLDADLLFFEDPKVLTDEMGEKSVLITEHRYSPEYDQAALSGIYCVQFVTFKNTPDGLTALKWWMDACLEWCYARFEDRKFGDQKYLDDWTERFEGVHVLEHPGGGVAPWNSTQYNYFTESGNVYLRSTDGAKNRLIFYHFHDFRYCVENSFRLTAEQYVLGNDLKKIVYGAYLKALANVAAQVQALDPAAVFHENLLPLKWIKVSLSRRVKFLFKGHYKNYVKSKALNLRAKCP
ncbi:glycosyl transferase [Dyadobacter luticola]|uniref:Glycosyl transferase n=2 Tax=Dyadobacter luticola TaxID=1979387 RepID=A0A5R9L6U9_9BACT|nr:glycosyl transferase [Dyadobacter luticola]